MLYTHRDMDMHVKDRTDTLEALRLQLAQREGDLRSLRAQYEALLEQFLAERERAEKLVNLSERFGVR